MRFPTLQVMLVFLFSQRSDTFLTDLVHGASHSYFFSRTRWTRLTHAMSFLKHFDASMIPRTRVELHLHLDGSIRHETIWELAQKKRINLGVKSLADLQTKLIKVDSTTLADFLDRFAVFMPTVVGDLEAVERISYELCEDQAREGAAYFEARYSPHFLASKEKCVTPKQVVEAVNCGLRRGECDFQIKARSIIACVIGNDDWSRECLKFCEEYQNKGVVGIDIAKDEAKLPEFTKGELAVYERAKHLGISRTAHAGESGGYQSVMDAMVKLHCDRVGHGYRVFQDPTGKTFKMAQEKNLHFEACPYSSVLTGGCPLSSQKHSIIRFAEEDANFSISKDDTTITGSTLDDEYDFLRQLGLTEAHFIRANLNAARSCFLSAPEKKDLIESLKEEYGISPMKEADKNRLRPVQPVPPVRPLPPIRHFQPTNPGGARKKRGLLARLCCPS
ncbi:adenosine deaminase isoform X2 [Rhipicephalus sanguineus]|uniref:adenosine deaminase isoform X2 n=1 Tax=Rhipicephalus sanguineus TaxID=34632 RepID=UPI0020C1D91B|nr:adenosine deaminase isoform X2 [Rhipicephalus sanguineus]